MRTTKSPVAIEIPKAPYIKCKGFLSLLIPIVVKGIPAYADSVRDPSVIGTPEHDEFWNKEIEKICNGFWIKDIWIPGRFYYYMNYKQMSTIRGVITPDMVDLHLELAYHIEHCLDNGKNLLCAKGRRKGISEAVSTMVVDYGWRFSEGFKAGVAAGNKTYVEDFVAKWRFSDSRLPPELSTKKLTDNDDEIIAGYQIKNQHNAYEERGTFNTIYARTMHTNPNMFKGLYLNVIISEEIGEHENWIEFYGASKDCLMSGTQQAGILIAFGTAGNVNKGSKDFKKIWQDPETYNFVRFMIPADRFLLYGNARNDYQRIPVESEYYKQYSDYQLIGCEDRALSLKNIMDRRARLLKQGNLKEYNEDLQNNPVNEQEMFRKTVINNFNINKLNEQQAKIDSLPHPKWTKYKMDWVKDERGMIKIPLEVSIRALKPHEDQDECLWVIDGEQPRKYQGLYTAGIDGYDQDTAKASKSLGAMCIRIRNNTIQGAMSRAPVAVINCRPKRKELFYDLCLKAAVYYNLIGNVLVDVGAALVMQYFKENNGWKYLADRPRKFEAENSEQTHEKGVRLTTFSRPRMSSLMQSDIEDNYEQYWFSELVNQLGNYDEVEIGSDNDLADAHGLSIMQDVSNDFIPRSEEDVNVENRWDVPQFQRDENGELRLKSNGPVLKNIQQDHELFGMMFGKKQ
jgi:hypothetical protein